MQALLEKHKDKQPGNKMLKIFSPDKLLVLGVLAQNWAVLQKRTAVVQMAFGEASVARVHCPLCSKENDPLGVA